MPVEADFQRLIEEAAIPGVAAAVVRGDRLEQILCCGLRSANAPELVDENTVFDAASLTKPVFAHAVLQLADQGWLSLDTQTAALDSGESVEVRWSRDPRIVAIPWLWHVPCGAGPASVRCVSTRHAGPVFPARFSVEAFQETDLLAGTRASDAARCAGGVLHDGD